MYRSQASSDARNQDGSKHPDEHPHAWYTPDPGHHFTQIAPLLSKTTHEHLTPSPLRVAGSAETRCARGAPLMEEEDFFTEILDVLTRDTEGPLDGSYDEPGSCLGDSDFFPCIHLRKNEPEMSQIVLSEAIQGGILSDAASISETTFPGTETPNPGSVGASQSVFRGQISKESSQDVEGAINKASKDKGTCQPGGQVNLKAPPMLNNLSGATHPVKDGRKTDLELSTCINDVMCATTRGIETKKAAAYTGVIKHSRNNRWEAHIWIPSLRKQVYLGCYENAIKAATAYDIAVLTDRGKNVVTNLPKSRYTKFLEFVTAEGPSVEEVLTLVRRFSNGFTRGTCKFRGVTKHPNGHWEARIGVAGNRNIYLGLHETEAGAGKSYDRARVRMKGANATTNFPISDYVEQVKEHEIWKKEMKTPRKTMAGKLYSQWVRFGGEDLLTRLIEKQNEKSGSH